MEKPLCLINQQKYLGINLQADWHDDADIKRQPKAIYIPGIILVQKLLSWCEKYFV